MHVRARPLGSSDAQSQLKREYFALNGKTIVVTGAVHGVGLAVGELIVELGGNLIATDRNAEALAQRASSLPAENL